MKLDKDSVREYYGIVDKRLGEISNAIERSGIPHEKASDVAAYIGYLVYNDYYEKCIKEEDK